MFNAGPINNSDAKKGFPGSGAYTAPGEYTVTMSKVINGASEIIAKIFDNKGLHTRAAISSNSLPLGVAVEVDAIFEIN